MADTKLAIAILLILKFHNHQTTAQVLHYSYKNVLSTEYRCEFLFVSLKQTFENATELSTPHLPDKTDDDVDSIEFRHGSFASTFPTMICEKFKNLKYISMDRGFVGNVGAKTFENCTQLEQLWLNIVNEETLWESYFENNPKLRNLKIFSISLKTLTRSFLASVNETLTELEMTITSDSFTFPSDFLTSLSNLRFLDLNIDKLADLPPSFFENSEKLEVLHMVNSNIQDLPRNIFKQLKNLQDLGLSRNRIKAVHLDSFGSHPSLMTVDLSDNPITSIDPKFFQLPSLLYLFVPDACSKNILIQDKLNGSEIKNHVDTCTKSYRPRD
jgi:Leucine-rich repeat (LRR) protein